MAKNPSQNRIRSTEALVSRSDLPSLRALNQNISSHLLNAMTVVDAEDFPKIQNIQTIMNNKENDVQNLIIQQVNNYNQQLSHYNTADTELATYGGIPPAPGNNAFRHYSGLLTARTTAQNAMTLIAPFSTTPLDALTPPTVGNGTLIDLVTLLTSLKAKNPHWDTIATESAKFNTTGTIIPVEGTGKLIAPELFNFGQQPAANVAYGLYNPDSSPTTVGNITIAGISTPCYQIHFDNNGTKTVGYVPQVQLEMDATTGQLRVGLLAVPHTFAIYDLTGRAITPSNDFTLEIHVGASYNMHAAHPTVTDFGAGPTALNLLHTKPLTVKRSVSSFDKNAVLTNPAFTIELNLRMGIAHRQHIAAIDNKDSQIYQRIRGYLDKHPDFARLSDSQKEEFYHRVLGLTQVSTYTMTGMQPVATPVTRELFGGAALSASINATQSRNTTANVMSDHSVLFADYVQGKDIDPKPSIDDTKNEVAYRNWLSRNLTALTKNYIAHRLSSYLSDNHVTQAINDTITGYTTNYEQTQLNGATNMVANMQIAASRLRGQRPKGAAADGINKRTGKNDSRLRLMAGKSATMSDMVKTDDGTEKSYTTTLNTRSGKGMSATLTLPNGKNLTLVAPTPGDLLSKILTCARIDESQGGQRMRLMMAFGTIKALVKLTRDTGAPMTIPINGTRDELRIDLADDDTISVARYDYNTANDEFVKSPRLDFDENNPDHKLMMTNNFITDLNGSLNTILDNHYSQFKTTMSDGTNIFKRFGRFMMFERGRMTYEADSNIFGVRSLRGWMKKAMNRKEIPVEGFSFPIQSGNKQGSVSYDPKGYITVEIDGKIRKDKNLAKLVNPWAMRNVFGILQRKQNMTDGFEMQIMNGIYSQLSGQLMQNSRVNKYTYLVRDPQNGVMYACYAGEDGTPRMGIIEHTNQNDMLMMDRQRGGRHVGIPEQGLRELNEEETQSVLSRPYIMDTVLQNMLKAREEIFRVPLTGYRSMGLSANVASQLAIAGAVGGVDILAGGWLSTHASSVAYAVGNFTTGTLLPGAEKVITTTGKALGNALDTGYGVARKVGWGLRDGAKAPA